ncbi:MAG: MFS transporter [Deltaproteobacteria bacterium]|nr:MFS transporter [Deltaproteobacteria bacterium]
MSKRSPLLPIFLIVLVDVLGFTIVIPLLAFYSESFGATPLIATLVVSVYAVCSLLSTPIIGKLSDTYGRKRLLLISQVGTFAGFILLGSATALWMVFVGRILDGLTAGNLSLAQAYISDHTKPENRTKAFGVIGVAFGIGFMFGPGLGGWLNTYENILGMHVPFLAAALLSLLSIAATALLLTSEKPPQDADPNPGPGGRRPGAFDWATYAEYFGRPALRSLFLQFVLFSFAFSCFFSGFALFAERRFTRDGVPWTATEVGYLFTFAGFLGILLQGGLLGRLVKKYGELKLTVAGFISGIVGYALLSQAPADNLLFLVGITVISSFAHGVLRPVLTAQITKAVGRHEQGVALGISGSLGSIAMALAPPAGGVMLDHEWTVAWALIPMVAASLGLLFCLAGWSRAKAEP